MSPTGTSGGGGAPIIDIHCHVFTGKDIRFRLIGQNLVRLDGKNISLSVVGRGPVAIKGAGGLTDGTYSVNGGDYTSLPDEIKRFVLGPPAPPPLSIVQ